MSLFISGFIAVWLLCGLGAAGIATAYFDGEYPASRHLAFGIIWGFLGGPFTLLLSYPLSNRCYHGWHLRKPKGE